MCGIVGYYGPKDPKDIILNGLKALEYRGYDSAGVAIFKNGEFRRIRAEGKLSVLAEKLKSEKFDGPVGIGHTRWATHGPPVERNAHPHSVRGVSIVHNGIIENYAELREELLRQGAKPESETDSELIAHLLATETDHGTPLLEAVLKTVPRLTGAYSVLAVAEAYPDQIVAFKNGPPLIIGVLKDSVIVASDIQAIINHTKNVYYLDDNEVAHVVGCEIKFFDLKGREKAKKLVEVRWTEERAEKQGYRHFMLKEIFEQPRAVAAAMDPHIRPGELTVELKGLGFSASSYEEYENLDLDADFSFSTKKLADAERVFMVACGTSFYAAMAGEYLIENIAGLPAEVDIASEFRYRHPVLPKNSLVIVISQSGETADTLAALRMAKEMGALTLSICNVRRSSIDREAHGHLYMNAGPEIGVASTKAFACTLTVLNLFAMALAKAKDRLSKDQEHKLVQSLLAAPSQMETVLAYDKFFAEAANTLKAFRGFLYMGRGISYPMAMEGALKLKELAYRHAEGYAAGEMKHGPLALIDSTMAVVMLAPKDQLYEKTVSNLEEVKARGGQIISIGTGDNEKLRALSQHYLSLPEAHWTVNPLLELIPLQLMAYHIADAHGYDVDQPRNLAKSVTVE